MLRHLVGMGVALCVLAAVFGALQRFWPAQRGLRRTGREWRTDLSYWLLSPIVNRPLAQVAVIATLVPAMWLLGRPMDRDVLAHGYGPVAALPAWMQLMLVLVIGDFLGYWMHRGLHTRRLWRIHAIHHASRELTWMAAARVHPLNDVFTHCAQAVPFVLLGFSPLLIGMYLPFLTFYAILLHANVNCDFGALRYVLTSPTFHRWHHADDARARDCNFAGLLPLWDVLFGTLYMPHGERAQRFGIHDETVPNGWFAQMAYPLRRRARVNPVSTSPSLE